jgi:hypothetical protein
MGTWTGSLRMCLKKGIRNPSRVPHDVNSLSCACTALATGGSLVYRLVFPKVRRSGFTRQSAGESARSMRSMRSMRGGFMYYAHPGVATWSPCSVSAVTLGGNPLDIGVVVGEQGKATVRR